MTMQAYQITITTQRSDEVWTEKAGITTPKKSDYGLSIMMQGLWEQ